jgi:hypothetical protein
MSASDGLKQSPVQGERAILSRLKYLRGNVAGYFKLFARKPQPALKTSAPFRLGAGTLGAAAVIVITMMMIDAPSIDGVAHLPHWLIATFDRLTDLGISVWFLAPIALVLASDWL